MKKLKLFLENMLVYGFGGIIGKIIPLIMVPLVTRLMPDTAYFGLSDLANTLLSFASALALMGMYDAMYRMFFEKEDKNYQKTVCSTALIFTIFTSAVVSVIMVLLRNQIAQLFFGDGQYVSLVDITAMATLVGATNTIVAAPTRMQNKRIIYVIVNAVGPVLSYSISIPLILNGYYVMALPLAALISAITIEATYAILNRSWMDFRKFDFGLLKQMLYIALPLLPNFLVYWIFSSSDRVMITNLMDVGAAGIYAVSSKLGYASQLIYTAFSGGWQYYAFSTMREKNQVKSNSMVFEYLGVISFGVSVFFFAWSEPIFKILFMEDYFLGFVAAPYLFLAPLLQMLFQIAANQFIVIKKTWPNILILSLGAVVNVVLNLTLIPIIGIEGAAIATLIGYAISDVICVAVLCRMKLMVISRRFCIAALATLMYILLWRLVLLRNVLTNTLLAVIVCVVLVMLYRKDLMILLSILKGNKGETENDHAE